MSGMWMHNIRVNYDWPKNVNRMTYGQITEEIKFSFINFTIVYKFALKHFLINAICKETFT